MLPQERQISPGTASVDRGDSSEHFGIGSHAQESPEAKELRAYLRESFSRDVQRLGDRVLNALGERMVQMVKHEFRKFMLEFVVVHEEEDSDSCEESLHPEASVDSEIDLMKFVQSQSIRSGVTKQLDRVSGHDNSWALLQHESNGSSKSDQVESIDNGSTKYDRPPRNGEKASAHNSHRSGRNNLFTSEPRRRSELRSIAEADGSGHEGLGDPSRNPVLSFSVPAAPAVYSPSAPDMSLMHELPGMSQHVVDEGQLIRKHNNHDVEVIQTYDPMKCFPNGDVVAHSEDNCWTESEDNEIPIGKQDSVKGKAVKFLHRQMSRQNDIDKIRRKVETVQNEEANNTKSGKSFGDALSLDIAHSALKNLTSVTCGDVVRVFIRTEYFDYIMGFFLMTNAVLIGLQVDHMSHQDDDQVPLKYLIFGWVFAVIFSLELAARIFLYRRKFLVMKGWQWNLFDTIVVCFQILDELAQLALKGTSAQDVIDNLGILRLLRLARIARLIRMVRLIPELKSMVCLISASMWSFFWTVVLLSLMMYCFAVYYTEMATDLKVKGKTDQVIVDAVALHWGGLGTSILSLYMAITGGEDWRNFTDPFQSLESYLAHILVFAFYIAFSTLVMLNLVTGVFVEGAQRIIKEDRDSELIKQVSKLFLLADTDSSHDISWEEFSLHLENKRMDEYFKAVDLRRNEAKDLFKLLDVDHSGSISVEEFVRGCLRLRGPARSVDLAALVYDFRQKDAQMKNAVHHLDHKITGLNRLMKQSISIMHGEVMSYSTYVPATQAAPLEQVLV